MMDKNFRDHTTKYELTLTQSAAAGAMAGADLPARLAPVLQLVAVQPLLGTLAQLSCTTLILSHSVTNTHTTLYIILEVFDTM